MTTTDRTDIIAILQAHHDLLGVDKARVTELINEISNVYATDLIKSPTVTNTVNAVEEVTNIRLTAMQIADRERYLVEARQLMCYALREHCGLTFKTIGRIIDRDHATVIYGIKQVQNNPRIFEGWQKKVEGIVNGIK